MRLKLKQSMLQIHFFRAEIFLPIWSGVEGITACIFSTYYASNLLIRLHLLFFYFSILPPAWLICPFGTNLLGWFWLSIWFLNVLYTEGLFFSFSVSNAFVVVLSGWTTRHHFFVLAFSSSLRVNLILHHHLRESGRCWFSCTWSVTDLDPMHVHSNKV